MRRSILLRRELIVDFDGAPVIFAIGRARFIQNVALAAQRFAFLFRLRVALQDFVVKRCRVLRLAEFALDHGLFDCAPPISVRHFS